MLKAEVNAETTSLELIGSAIAISGEYAVLGCRIADAFLEKGVPLSLVKLHMEVVFVTILQHIIGKEENHD